MRSVRHLWRLISSEPYRLGLHFDSQKYGISSTERLEYWLKYEKAILENLFDVSIVAFSFHNPDRPFFQNADLTYAGMINTYAVCFKTTIGYCSDSNGYWRHER